MALLSVFFRSRNLPWPDGIDICRSSEATALQLQAMEDLKFVSDEKSKSKASEDAKLTKKGGSPVILCKFCG